MHKKAKSRSIPIFLVIILDIILVLAVLVLMDYVRHLLESDAKINLTEIVTQNKDVITSKIMLEVNDLALVSKQLADRYSQSDVKDDEHLTSIFLQYSSEEKDSKSFLALSDGMAIFSDGESLDISGRTYFKLSMEGTENISERVLSRQTGEDVFIISVPMEYKGEIIGSIQKPYTPQEMYEICSVSLFSEKGDMYIINSQGYILVSSRQDVYSLEAENYYRILYLDNPEASKRLEQDILLNKAGFLESTQNGLKYFSAYTPITQVYDWYLITSVETNAVSPNGNIVIKLFYFILIVTVVVFGLTLLYVFRLKKKQQQKLERFALVDPVTGGSTYAGFRMKLEELRDTPSDKPYYIFTFDIDNFKYINNYYGFESGDRILHDIYNYYSCLLLPDEYCSRDHGDHFILLLSDASKVRLDSLFQPEFTFDGITIYLSAGLYPISDFNESVSLMVDKANMAKHKAKGFRKKNVEVYSAEYDQQLIVNEQTKRAVELALDAGHIIPFYQPKVDINTNTLVGAEALARWRSEDGTIIPPYRFIPICEQSGLIEAVDLAIFEQTLKFIRRNLDLNIQCVPISINLSRSHLLNKDFLTGFLQKLKDYQVPPALIELELTETAIFDNHQIIGDFITMLHKNGLQVSMDDFGSGYSSLHLLKDVDIDVLKIDRGFLMETTDSKRQRVIFEAIAQMASSLNIKVVVEGVETPENVAMMREFGCNIAQGFYYSRPISEEEFENIYRRKKL